MSSRRELYKEKSRGGLGSREARGRLKAQESKSGRDALLLSRRRIPLSAVQEDRTQKTENGALSASQKSLSRLQKLQEWKKKRDEVKEKEKASKTKLPPFHGGGRGIATNAPVHISKPLQFQPPRVGKASVSEKFATYGKQTSSTSSSSSTKLASNTTSAKVGKMSTKSAATPLTSLTEAQKVVEKGSSKWCPPSTGVLPPAVEESRRTLRSKPPVVLRASKRISSLKEKKEELKAKPAPARKERVAKPPTSRGGRSTDTSTQTARNGRKLRDREETVAMPEGVVPSRRSGRKVLAKGVGTDTALPAKEKASKKKVAPIKMKLAYSESSSDSNETSPKLSPGLRYASPPPSVEVERGQLSTASPFVLPLSGPPQLPPSPSPATCIPDSAWILTTNSYALLPPPPHPCRTPGKTVEDVLGPCTFSPFAFTAGTTGVGGARSDTHSVSKRRATPGKPFVFNFMKAVEGTPMSLRVEALGGGGGGVDVSSDNISVDSLDCDPAPTVAASSDDVVAKETYTEVKMTEIVATATDPVPSVAEEPIEVSEMVTVATEPVVEQNELSTETEVVATMTETVAMPTDVSEETEVLVTRAEVVSETTGKEYTTPKVPIPISSLANMGVAAWCGVPVVRGGVESEGDTEAVLPESESQQEVTENEKGGVDLDYFRKVHDDVVDILTGKCSEWRAKNETVEAEKEREGVEEERCKILEEAVDQIRTTVLQAELLMRKKMKQYLGLVDNAATDGGKTSSDDLQGFWDLVYIQVEVLYRKFDDLSECEQNNWQPAQTSKTVSKKKGKKRVGGGAAAKSGGKSTSEKQTAAKEKREAMRSRLREMKMAAAAKRTREGGEEEESKLQEQEPSSKKVKDSPATSNTVAMATSDSAHPNDHITPPRSDDHHDNGGYRSDQRKSTGRNRHRSRRLDSGKSATASLIDFSQPPADEESSHTTAEAVSITLNPSGFSPSQCDTAVFYEAGESEVPTAQLLSFNDQPVMSSTLPPLKSPLKWVPKGMSRMTPVKKQVSEGASLRCFVSITPSKRVRDVLEADVIMSPARRSLRIAEKFGGTSDKAPGNYQVSSLGDLPDGLDIGYLPNKALL